MAAQDLDAWGQYATSVLGLTVGERSDGDTLYLRMDPLASPSRYGRLL
ncbi:hypothetical protein [Rhodococcus wratislaviensis]